MELVVDQHFAFKSYLLLLVLPPQEPLWRRGYAVVEEEFVDEEDGRRFDADVIGRCK